MLKIMVINGPNLNMLGIREKDIYGTGSYEDLLRMIRDDCDRARIHVDFFQSNHEGALIDAIQSCYGK